MRSRFCSSASTITLPTKWTLSAGTPSQIRLVTALRSVANSRSDTESVAMRLTSSGISRSKLRRPASTCATGMPSLTAVSAAASVELTSPTTSTRSGECSWSALSMPSIARAVWIACDPDPTCRKTSGRGSPRSRKKTPESSLS